MPGYGLGYSSLVKRSSGPSGPSYGTLTTAWIAATGETDLTILGALNTLESDLTTYGLTSKMKALYPFVGGTSTKHSYNFMNTAAFQITFNGGWTHSSNGAAPNGTNAYGDTGFNPISNSLSTANCHLSYYARTSSTASDGAELGSYSSSLQTGPVLQAKSVDFQNRYFYYFFKKAANSVSSAPTGLITGSSVSDTRRDIYNNGTSVANNTTTDTSSLNNFNIYIGAANIDNSSVSSYSNAQCAYACIGQGLSSTDVSNLYTAVQAFQTTLSRNV